MYLKGLRTWVLFRPGAQLYSILVVHLLNRVSNKKVVLNTSYRVNFQNIGGACAPDAPSMLGAPGLMHELPNVFRFYSMKNAKVC